MKIHNLKQLASVFDHTNLRPDANIMAISDLCSEAADFGFASVCVLPSYVENAYDFLKGTDVKVCTVIGFPIGGTYGKVKLFEAETAVLKGASELDMVMNIPAFKNLDYQTVRDEIKNITALTKGQDLIVKVIIETCLLNEKEKIAACKIVSDCGADFIKTSTGFSCGGANLDDIDLFNKYLPPDVKIKAAGGIRKAHFAIDLLEAGADRIGSSSSIQIMKEAESILIR